MSEFPYTCCKSVLQLWSDNKLFSCFFLAKKGHSSCYYSAQIMLLKLYLKLMSNNHWIDANCDKALSTVPKM